MVLLQNLIYYVVLCEGSSVLYGCPEAKQRSFALFDALVGVHLATRQILSWMASMPCCSVMNKPHDMLMSFFQIRSRVEYLEQEVGLKESDLATTVKNFPEVLGLGLEERIIPNMEYLEKTYFLKGPVKAKVILRKPRIIGNVLDCGGDCQGECSRCWAQF